MPTKGEMNMAVSLPTTNAVRAQLLGAPCVIAGATQAT
jgi:hypothetical protein